MGSVRMCVYVRGCGCGVCVNLSFFFRECTLSSKALTEGLGTASQK